MLQIKTRKINSPVSSQNESLDGVIDSLIEGEES